MPRRVDLRQSCLRPHSSERRRLGQLQQQRRHPPHRLRAERGVVAQEVADALHREQALLRQRDVVLRLHQPPQRGDRLRNARLGHPHRPPQQRHAPRLERRRERLTTLEQPLQERVVVLGQRLQIGGRGITHNAASTHARRTAFVRAQAVQNRDRHS
jgi:hypothetical protein